MSKYIIRSSSGASKSTGCPTYTGTYMKPGMLEFREIASPSPIEWAVGDYVDYDRTGFRYKLYSIPQVKRQARNNSYGGAFLYQSVQFFDDSHILSIVPFRDLVAGDNRVHFSTQSAIAVFTNVAGIAEKIQACLDVDNHGWVIRLATTAMGASQEVVDLMAEARDFSVSGVSLQGVLDKVYEVWPEIGWVYSRGEINNEVKNIITIGGAGLNASTAPTYAYGKGNGLLNITRTVANADELANRIYAYGSSRNMLSGWYRDKNIKDAESVDIQHLMLPINPLTAAEYPALLEDYPGWGRSVVSGRGLLPDPAKAYVEPNDEGASIAKLGLREKIVYFDGTQDLEEIYPTIKGMTIADVRYALNPSGSSTLPRYYPSTSVYQDDTVRVDKVKSVETVFDTGLAADSGKQAILTDYATLNRTEPIVIIAGEKTRITDIFTKSITIPESGSLDYSTNFGIDGAVGAPSAKVKAWLEVKNGDTMLGKVNIEVTQNGNNWVLGDASFSKNGLSLTSGATITAKVWVEISADETSSSDRQYLTGITAEVSTYLSRNRAKTFKITLRQIGFDIAEQAALGNGKTIHFRSGKCAGRTFTIKSCTYQSATDSWLLDVIRSEDESLSQWFPNYDYPVVAEDEFVLLDIAMPDSYVYAAEVRLLVAAQQYLEWSKKEVWQYTPEIDAKFMIENSRTIRPAEYMILVDSDIVDSADVSRISYLVEHNQLYFLTSNDEKILLSGSGYSGAVLVDSVTINEGDSTIPTYKVTLRERKRKKASGTAEVQNTQSNPVTSVNAQTSTPQVSAGDSNFFEEDDTNVKLKDVFGGLKLPQKRLYLDDTHFIEIKNVAVDQQGDEDTENPIWAIHTNINFVIDGWASVGGSNPSGSGINLLQRIWESLTTNSDQYRDNKVHSGHIPIDTATLETNSNTIALKSSLKTKIDNSIAGAAYGTGAVAPTKLYVVKGDYPSSLESNALYFKVEEASNNNS